MKKTLQYALRGAIIIGVIVFVASIILVGDLAGAFFASLIFGPIGLIVGAIIGGIVGFMKRDIPEKQSLADLKEQLSLNSSKEDLDDVGLLLVQLLDNVHAYKRIEAIEKLIPIGTEAGIIDALKYAAERDSDTGVRVAAKNALKALSPQ